MQRKAGGAKLRNWARSQKTRYNTLVHTHTPAGCTAASHCLPGDTEGRDVEERVGGYAPGRHIKLLAGQRSSEQACVTQRFRIQQLSMQERASRWKPARSTQSLANLFGEGGSFFFFSSLLLLFLGRLLKHWVTHLSNSWMGGNLLCILFYCDCMKFPSNCSCSSTQANSWYWEHLRALSVCVCVYV